MYQQISITVPWFLQPLLHKFHVVWLYSCSVYTYLKVGSSTTWEAIKSIPYSNVFIPCLAILLIFWPLFFSVGMAALYAWAWIFWIITSMILGTLQVIYAAYQFLMISIDLLGLSMLKAYSVLRHTALYYLDIATATTVQRISGVGTNNNNTTAPTFTLKSRRRIWKEMLEKAGSYENFLKLRIEPKNITPIIKELQIQQAKNKNRICDAALPDPNQPFVGHKTTSSNSYNNNNNTSCSDKSIHPFGMNTVATSATMRRANSFSMNSSSYLMDHYDIDGQHRVFDSTTTTTSGSPTSSPKSINKVPRRTLSFSSGDKSPFAKYQNQLHYDGNNNRNNNSNSNKKELNTSDQYNIDPVIVHELGPKIADLLITTMIRLKDARLAAMEAAENKTITTGSTMYNTTMEHDSNIKASLALHYLLSAVVKRNHLTLDDILIENARNVAETGQYGLSNQSRQLIRAYYEEVQKGLDYIADSPLQYEQDNQLYGTTATHSTNHDSSSSSLCHNKDDNRIVNALPTTTESTNVKPDSSNMSNPQYSTSIRSRSNSINNNSSNHNEYGLRRQSELMDRITLLRKMKQNMGRTALMFSGGGAQAMYHLGVIRALIESRLYDDISVISGTSGGSIAAAMCAMKTADELYNDVCVPTVSTDYGRDGKMKELNIRWFPPMVDMIAYWMKHRLVVDSAEFGRTCEFYYADITFEEAFQRTGKHVCITVSASRASGNTAQRLLLNHISTPNVTIASAVRASCALPGVMAPAKLLVKNSDGILEPFEVDGVEWIDGSVQADLPFQRIATLFAVTSFIVSQTNFHIVPFIHKNHHPNHKTFYWRLFQTLEWDIRNRALKLSRLGLFPRIFGQDISKVFKQKYHGNLTIVPRFTPMQTFGLKILSNPTVKDMEGYLKFSQIAVWPYLNAIRDMIRLEKSLDDCLSRLEARMRTVVPDADLYSNNYNDDIESIASGSFVGNSCSGAFRDSVNGLYGGSNNQSLSNIFNANNTTTGSNTNSSITRSVRIVGRTFSSGGGAVGEPQRETERLRQRVYGLEQENGDLRRELERLRLEAARNELSRTTDDVTAKDEKENLKR